MAIAFIGGFTAPGQAGAATAGPSPADLRSLAGRAVAALVSDHPEAAMSFLPADFEQRIGYRPVPVDGVPANPDGGCSSPIPLPPRFEPMCKSHDLGYDLLRYGARAGHPLGAWARKDLDATLIRRMRESCHDPLCTQSAELAATGLRFNTWRQGSGVPVSETPLNLITSTVERAVLNALDWR